MSPSTSRRSAGVRNGQWLRTASIDWRKVQYRVEAGKSEPQQSLAGP